jgi:hypothetical protein
MHLTHAYTPDGGYYDVCNPNSRTIDLNDVAARLSRTIRFSGAPQALSVAQHEVLGAEAIIAEGGSPIDAALFLHHDDHKFILGDQVTPVATALGLLAPDFSMAWSQLKANWDRAIYATLGLPPPDAWLSKQVELVTLMNWRMSTVEKMALFGPRSVAMHPPIARRTPRFNASLCPPWPAEKAAEQWKLMHRKLTGRIIR